MRNLAHRSVVLGMLVGAAGCAAPADSVDAIGEAREAVTLSNMTVADNSAVPEERCRLTQATASQFGGSLRQLRITKTAGRLSLCTIDDQFLTAGTQNDSRIEMRPSTREDRVGASTPITGVTISDEHAGQAGIATPMTTPLESFTDDVREWSSDNASAKVIYTAPHGSLESPTESQINGIYQLGEARNAFWLARYHNSYSGTVGDSIYPSTSFHITAADISEHSFLALDPLINRSTKFTYAVSFHGYSDDTKTGDVPPFDVVVGGGGQVPPPGFDPTLLFRRGIAENIEDAVQRNQNKTIRAAYDLYQTVDPTTQAALDFSDLRGTASANFVNRLAANGQGIQIEQSNTLRKMSGAPTSVANAVKSVLDCVLDTPDTIGNYSHPTPYNATSPNAGVAGGACKRWIVNLVASSTTTFTISAGMTASCATGTDGYVDIYRFSASGIPERRGGGRITAVTQNGACSYPPVSLTLAAGDSGRFRVVVRGTNGSGQEVPTWIKVAP